MSNTSLRAWQESFVLRASRRVFWVYLASAVLVVLAILFCGLSPLLKILLLITSLAALWRAAQRHAQLRVVRLRGDRAEIQGDDHQCWLYQAPLQYLQTRWWISVEVWPMQHQRWYRRRWLTVFADQLSAEDFHRLGVWLRHHPRGK